MSTYSEALRALTDKQFVGWAEFRLCFKALKDEHRQSFIDVLITEQKLARAKDEESFIKKEGLKRCRFDTCAHADIEDICDCECHESTHNDDYTNVREEK